jgi:hypothetical protein
MTRSADQEVLMPTVTLDTPGRSALGVAVVADGVRESHARRRSAALVLSQGDLSQSTAAEVAGTTRAEFIDALARRRIGVVQVTTDELQDEIHRE